MYLLLLFILAFLCQKLKHVFLKTMHNGVPRENCMCYTNNNNYYCKLFTKFKILLKVNELLIKKENCACSNVENFPSTISAKKFSISFLQPCI